MTDDRFPAHDGVPVAGQRAPLDHHIGIGNWQHFTLPVERVFAAAEAWRAAVAGVERPWLCWHVNDRWTRIQSRLVREVGWTPVIGYDPRFDPPSPTHDAVVVDFNLDFGFPLMYMHFPLEFAYLWSPRLAFWHSDLLCRPDVMRDLANTFAGLPDGRMAAVRDLGGRRNWLNFRKHRYWELVGCTTAGASESQYRHGAGWWQHFECHPNCPSPQERIRRGKCYYDHGTGIMYWQRRCGGKVTLLDRKRVEEGHCTSINFQNYQRLAPVNRKLLGAELDLNFDLEQVARRLGVEQFL